MAKLSALGHAALVQETTYGTTPGTPSWAYIPYDTVKVEDEIKKINDEARRGVLSKTFGVYNATRSSKYEIDFDAYPEVLGYFLKGILGGYPAPVSTTVSNPTTAPTLAASGTGNTLPAATYYVVYSWANAGGETTVSPEASQAITAGQALTITIPALPAGATSANIYVSTSTGTETRQANITGTSLTISAPLVAGAAKPSSNTTSTVYTHTFNVSNTLAPSFTISDNNAMTERLYKGSLLTEVGFKIGVEEVLKTSAKFVGKASVTGTGLTPAYTTTNPFMGYTTILNLNGIQNNNLVSAEFNIKRDVNLIFTATNTQDVVKYSSGRIDVTGKLTFDVEDESELNIYLNGTQQSLELLVARDANTSLDLKCNKVDFTKATVDRGSEFIRVDAEFRAIYNTVDNGMTTIILKNGVNTY